MLRPQGWACATGPDQHVERDTITCAHCNAIQVVEPPPAVPKSGFCRLCMKHICSRCIDKACLPFEKRLERIEARDRLRRAAGV